MAKDLYVMGLIPEPIKSRVLQYQKHLSQVYNIYGEYCPEPHITLGKILYDNPCEIAPLIAGLGTAFRGTRPVKVCINGTSCFGPPYKSVNLHNEPTLGLKSLSALIADTAKASGLTPRDQPGGWQYHISIANPAFAKNEWSESEYEKACEILKKEDFHESFLLNQIQLWHPVERDYVVHSYILE
jgi:hypothetical protein